jgi:hypothetical protein
MLDKPDGIENNETGNQQADIHRYTEDSMGKESKTTLHGRSAKTGKFTTIEKARAQPNTHVVERVPKPGRGDTKKSK